MSKNSLDIFKDNNKEVEIVNSKSYFVIKKCWGDDSFVFKFKTKKEMAFMKDFVFPTELFAIYHKNKGLYEFIFLPLKEKFCRSFEYIYQGKKFNLYYDKPSIEFEKLVKCFSPNVAAETITDRFYGLMRFCDYYKEKRASQFPINFFIKGDFCDDYHEHLTFFKHVNFLMTYYDRVSPTVIIMDPPEDNREYIVTPCKSKSEAFPNIINTKKLDLTLLELINAARNSSSIRLKFIFYFQVLEYCSYYYIENNMKRQISNIIKSPDILNSDKYSQKIIELYSDYFKTNKDDKRMDRLIKDLCTFDDIKDEIKTNSVYFINETCFEGGLVIKGLFNKEEEIDNPPIEILSSIRRNIDTIRNVLVHARESRENVVISPSQKNALLLKPYLFLLRRLAEIVVLKFE